MDIAMIELKRATYGADTQWLFKKFLCTLVERGYQDNPDSKRQRTKHKRDKMVNFLNVSNDVKPILFNDMKYSKKEHEDCLFMFLDDELQVIGFLKGNTWNDKWNQYENYQPGRTGGRLTWEVVKNRKNMTEKAGYILMFTSEMMKRKQRQKVSVRTQDHIRELQYRLTQYKKKKHGEINYEQFSQIAKIILNKLTEVLFTPEEDEIVKRCRSLSGFNDTISDIFRKVTEIIKDYRWNYKEHEREKKFWIEKYGEKEYKKHFDESVRLHHSYDPRKYVIELVNYKNVIFKEE